MGIHDFTKVFPSSGVVNFRTMKETTLAIDASIEIYRSSLGMTSVNSLTDAEGHSTVYINTLFANMIKYQVNHIHQIWVFDHDSTADESAEFHNPLKIMELNKRKCAKETAKKAISKLDEESYLFAECIDEPEPKPESEPEKKKPTKDSLEKRCFSLSKDIVNNVKFMLNCLNIQWIDSPAGYESEQICALLTQNGMADSVLSSDADSLLFGAKSLIKKNIKDKKYYIYRLDDIFKQTENIQNLRKIGIILGCDFAPKTPRIGAKTVLKKYMNVELTDVQKEALKHFERQCPLNSIVINNRPTTDVNAFSDRTKIDILINWLENKSFSRTRIKKQLDRVI